MVSPRVDRRRRCATAGRRVKTGRADLGDSRVAAVPDAGRAAASAGFLIPRWGRLRRKLELPSRLGEVAQRLIDSGFLKANDRHESLHSAVKAGVEKLLSHERHPVTFEADMNDQLHVHIEADGCINVYGMWSSWDGYSLDLISLTRRLTPTARSYVAWLLNRHYLFGAAKAWDYFMDNFFVEGKIDGGYNELHELEAPEEKKAHHEWGAKFGPFKRNNPWLFYSHPTRPPVAHELGLRALPPKWREVCRELLATKEYPFKRPNGRHPEPMILCCWDKACWITHCIRYIHHLESEGGIDTSDCYFIEMGDADPSKVDAKLTVLDRGVRAAKKFLRLCR